MLRKIVVAYLALGSLLPSTACAVNFRSENLAGAAFSNPTTLTFGPDDRLYVTHQDGTIRAHSVQRDVSGNYSVTATETILLVQQIPNHNDDGSAAPSIGTRQVTGLLAVGTPSNPVLYVTSSDPRIGGGGSGGDSGLDTNSGIISRLTWTGSAWDKVDLIRGLPRSEENHSNNGMALDASTNELYVAIGGMTNAGAPSNNFAFITEYALAACIIRVNLDAIDAMPVLGSGNTKFIYDLPTLDDPTRAGAADAGDPFGGNDGLNQAKLDPAGPIEIFSPGYRNAFDLVITEARRLYTWDNGANQGWGGHPDNEGTFLVGGELATNVTNDYPPGEPGSTGPGPNDDVVNNRDGLHLIGNIDSTPAGSYYGGHPCPIRANPTGAGLYTRDGPTGVFRTAQTGNPATTLPADWPPIPAALANPIEGDFQNPGVDDSSLFTLPVSTNGLAEYTASNFFNGLQGDLLAAAFDGRIYRVDLNAQGGIDAPTDVLEIASGFAIPIDVTTRGDADTFPGTIWVADYSTGGITVLEPDEETPCSGTYSFELDEDGDGYSNADELDAGSAPCNAASKPADFDHDFISDFNDPDDDNDGIPDTSDKFPIDSANGLTTHLPIQYELFNGNPGFGFFGLGFTGLMHDGTTDYRLLIEDETNSTTEIIAGGAVGLFTLNGVSAGDAALNTQRNAFQFGVNVMATTPAFTYSGRILGPVFTSPPEAQESMGIFVGTGSQDDFIKIVVDANGGTPGISVVTKVGGVASAQFFAISGIGTAGDLTLQLSVDPGAGTVLPSYFIGTDAPSTLGSPIAASGALLQALQGVPAVAMGVIATSRGASAQFNATWDSLFVTFDPAPCVSAWEEIGGSTGTFDARHEAAYTRVGDKFYLVGGRGARALNIYDPATNSWTTGATPPLQFHHFQGVALAGELWVAGAFQGDYPSETPVSVIHIYNPTTNFWRVGPTIPRPRGAAGAVVHNGKLYLVSGILNGHLSGHVAWFDCYDPATDAWSTLADAPRARDHYQAQVIDGKLWLAGGRRTAAQSAEGVFGNVVPEVDVYDFTAGTWQTISANIPTPRAGTASAALGQELIVAGGESPAQTTAHDEVEALDTLALTWRALPPMITGRHGSGLPNLDGTLYIASGSGNQGGGPELSSQERYLSCVNEFAPTIQASAMEVSLPAPPAQAGAPVALTLSNPSLHDLTLGSVTTDDPRFSILAAPPSTLVAGGQTALDLVFTPGNGDTGNIPATLTIVSNGTNTPILEIALTGIVTPLTEPEIAINANGPAYTAADGTEYLADVYFSGGDVFQTGSAIDGTQDDALYQTERYGAFTYNIPVTNGWHRLRLQFAEIYFNAPGLRVFDVTAEGATVLDDLDIFAQVGALAAHDVVVPVNVTDGTMTINFVAQTELPKLSALVITPIPPPTVTILSPANAARFATGAGIAFSVQANDDLGADVSNSAVWSSDLDGTFGAGGAFNHSGLSEGAHLITVVASNSVGMQGEASIQLEIAEPYLVWTDGFAWNGANSAKAGDPDFDGVTNELERAFNLHPLTPDANLLPFAGTETDSGTTYVTLTYRRNLDAPDLTYSLQSSTDLTPVSWSLETVSPENIEILGDDGATQLIKLRLPITTEPRLFLRVSVE